MKCAVKRDDFAASSRFACKFDCAFDCFGAAVGKEDLIESFRGDRHNRFSGANHLRMHRGDRGVPELFDLLVFELEEQEGGAAVLELHLFVAGDDVRVRPCRGQNPALAREDLARWHRILAAKGWIAPAD